MSTNWDELFYYDESSPTFLRWKVDVRSGRNNNQQNCSPGDVAGSIPSQWKKHSVVGVDHEQYLVHRIVFELCYGPLLPSEKVDHKDGNGWNNSKDNLRKVSHAVNMRNCKKRTDNKTGVVGVSKYTSRHGSNYYAATWKDLMGKQKSKTFSTVKYGEVEAFDLACEHRAKMIEQLNAQGAGYTVDHGSR